MCTRMGRWLSATGVALVVGMFVAPDAGAGGLQLYELGTADVGLASAGYSARAQDASTVYTNPAGMTRLEGIQLTGGLQLLYGDLKFSPEQGTSLSLGRGDGGNPVGWFPGGSLFYSHSLTNDLKVGLGIYGNFGLALEYDNNWVGRYYVQEGVLLGLSLQPTVAYRINQYLSVGAGFIAMYGVLRSQVAINNRHTGGAPDLPDGQLKADDEAWGFGANLGTMIEFSPSTRVGVTWTSPIKIDFAAPAEFSGLRPELAAVLKHRGLLDAKLDLGMTVPQGVMVSAFHQINETWAILGSFGWQQWSRFGRVEIGIDSTNPTSATKDLDFTDTYHVAVGVQLRPAPPLVVNLGIAYDSSFQDTSNVSPMLPAGWGWRFGVGTQYSVSKTVDLGGAFEYVYGGDLRLNRPGELRPEFGGRGDLVGVYPNVRYFFLAMNLNWRF